MLYDREQGWKETFLFEERKEKFPSIQHDIEYRGFYMLSIQQV